MGQNDQEWHSAPTNDTGNPDIWRRVTFGNDYGDNSCNWNVGTYLDMYLDGHVEVFTTQANDNCGPLGTQVNFYIELWFITPGGPRINPREFAFFVFPQMDLGGHKENIWRTFPSRDDVKSFQGEGVALSCYRHAFPIDPNNNNTLPSTSINVYPNN